MAPIIPPRNSVARALRETELESRSPSSPLHSLSRHSEPSSSSLHTTLSARSDATTARLLPRLDDNADIVPQTYGAPSGPDAGTVVGIVLGSVGGFLLVLWLIYTITNLGNTSNVIETGSVGGGSEVTRKSRRHRRRSRSSRPPRETVEVRRTERAVPVPVPVPMQAERIIVEERSRSRARPMPPMPPPPPRVVPDDSDDEVVVIEENTPPRRKDSRHQKRRSSRRSSEYRRNSGFREVDPQRYAGGNTSVRSVSRRRSPSRGR